MITKAEKERQKIISNIECKYIYSDSLIPLQVLIENLQKDLDKFTTEGYEEINLYIEHDYYYSGCSGIVTYYNLVRYENEEEYNKRIQELKHREAKLRKEQRERRKVKEEKEREEYERLKKKFGD